MFSELDADSKERATNSGIETNIDVWLIDIESLCSNCKASGSFSFVYQSFEDGKGISCFIKYRFVILAKESVSMYDFLGDLYQWLSGLTIEDNDVG
jgi:hypothetical protein